MSIFSGLSVGASAINVNQLALRVVGENIANAGTEGYVRQEVSLSPIASSRNYTLPIGHGVSAEAVTQQVDRYLQERARQANSSYAAADAQSTLFLRVEGIFNELTDEDLSTRINEFFSSIQDVANRPEDIGLRTVAIDRGSLVAETIRGLRSKLDNVQSDINTEVRTGVDQINNSLERIRQLNTEIVQVEAGSASDAGDLRVQRSQELDKIGKLIDIQVHEDPNGSINVLTQGDYLLFNGSIQRVGVKTESTDAGIVSNLIFEKSQSPLPTTGGRLGGIQQFRDQSLNQIGEKLDNLAANFIGIFNRIHSSGIGLDPYTQVAGTERTLDPTAVLTSDAAALNFPPSNGSFEVRVTDRLTGLNRTYVIDVDLDGVGTDDSLNSVVARINTVAFGGQPVASVNNQGRLEMQAPTGQSFTFAADSSGFLASMGVNTFFKGIDARTIAVNDSLRDNPRLFAVSGTGQPSDNQNALALASIPSISTDSLDGRSVTDYVSGIIEDLGSGSETAKTRADIRKSSRDALQSENLAITGVSLDEEAIKLVQYQRAFQASAQYISTLSEMLDIIVNLGR